MCKKKNRDLSTSDKHLIDLNLKLARLWSAIKDVREKMVCDFERKSSSLYSSGVLDCAAADVTMDRISYCQTAERQVMHLILLASRGDKDTVEFDETVVRILSLVMDARAGIAERKCIADFDAAIDQLKGTVQ